MHRAVVLKPSLPRRPKEGLINQTLLCGVGTHRHFPCVKRKENARQAWPADLINSQERIDQSYPKTDRLTMSFSGHVRLAIQTDDCSAWPEYD